MPFENYNDGRIGVVLGTGDIAVSTGALVKSLEGEENLAATPIAAESSPKTQRLDRLFFSQQAIRPMGDPTGLEGQRSDEFPWNVCLLFENAEAVDVVMEKLAEIRLSMRTGQEILKDLKEKIDALNARPSAILGLAGLLTRQPGFNPLNATKIEADQNLFVGLGYAGIVQPNDDGGLSFRGDDQQKSIEDSSATLKLSDVGINIPEERKVTILDRMRAQETAAMEAKMLETVSGPYMSPQSIVDHGLRQRTSQPKSQAMRYFLDTEFMENGAGSPIHLISLGIVSEDGKREFYAELEDAPLASANDWVRDNVIPKLNGPRMSRKAIAGNLLDTIHATEPQFWAYFGAYDWVVFCQLFERMIDMPKWMPRHIMDLKQLSKHLGVNRSSFPKQVGGHHALEDAKWNREVFRYLRDRAMPLECLVRNDGGVLFTV